MVERDTRTVSFSKATVIMARLSVRYSVRSGYVTVGRTIGRQYINLGPPCAQCVPAIRRPTPHQLPSLMFLLLQNAPTHAPVCGVKVVGLVFRCFCFTPTAHFHVSPRLRLLSLRHEVVRFFSLILHVIAVLFLFTCASLPGDFHVDRTFVLLFVLFCF